jgi:hypothetical protein
MPIQVTNIHNKYEAEVDLVFCLTGDNSSRTQSNKEKQAISEMMASGYRVAVSTWTGADIFEVRNCCLMEKNKNFRVDQKPFGGYFSDYRFSVWFDSDNYVTAEQIKKLISYDLDIVGGWCRISTEIGKNIDDARTNASFVELNDGRIETNPITEGEMLSLPRDKRGLIEVGLLGFGLMVIKKGVFESLGYPWFRSWNNTWEEDGKRMSRNVSDDLGFCLRTKEKGFKIFVDPLLRVGHEKRVEL